VLLGSAIENGLQSTTRYRNSARRGQNNKSRGRSSRTQRTSRRSSRALGMARSAVYGYSLPPLPGSLRRHDYELRSRYGQRYGPQFDLPEEQLERASLDEQQRRAMYFAGGNDYQRAFQSTYASPPVMYSSELFMPSVKGAPTVVSDSDDNEAMTPEPSFAVLEPTVLLPGDHNHSGSPGPTSNPYSTNPSAFCSTPNGSNLRYTMGDVVGVVDESQLSCCGWNGSQHSRQ